MSVLTISIQTGHYDSNNTPKEQRICLFYTVPDIEDEFYVIIKCPCYIDPRKKYIKKSYFTRPSMVSFFELLMSEHKIILSNLSRFGKRSNACAN